MWQKVDFIQQPAMTSSVVGLRRSSKALPKAKLAPKKGHSHCLVVCCPSDPLQLSESKQNNYIWELMRGTKNCNTCSQHLSIERAQFFCTTMPDCMSHHQRFKTWMNWAVKFSLICHIYLTSHQQTTTSSSILTTFCRESASITSRKQKMISKNLSNPEVQIFML